MGAWAILYGVMGVGTAAAAGLSGKKALWEAALLLLFCWGFQQAARWLGSPHRELNPALDAICGYIGLWIAVRGGSAWVFYIAALFALQGMVHVKFFTDMDFSFSARYWYDLKLNLLFLAQLGCVVFPAMPALWRRYVSARAEIGNADEVRRSV